MKKWVVGMFAALLLAGCGAQPAFETVGDDHALSVSATVRQIELELPKEAAHPVMESATGGSLYLCDGYMLTVQTLSGGDLNRTVQELTGYTLDQLQPVRSKHTCGTRYDLAWTAVGEEGQQVARAVILDDGESHYAVTVMADAADSGDLTATWQKLFNSVRLRTD